MRVEQEVGRHHDGRKHVVEIVRDAAGKLPHQLHLLLLRYLVFQFALRRGFQRINNRGFLIALFLLDRGDVEPAEALALTGQHGIDRRDFGLAERRLPDCARQRFAIARSNGGKDRTILCLAAGAVKQPREERVGANHAAMFVDRGDRHRRMMKESHEANFGGALRIAAVVARPIEHERPRGSGRTVGAIGDIVQHAHRHRAAAAGAQIEVEHLGLYLAWRGVQRGKQRRTIAGDYLADFEPAGADLGEIMIEPIGERGIEIDDFALVVDRKKSSGRVIEIVDGVLQFLKHVLLALTFPRDVRKRPDGQRRRALVAAERPDAESEPTRGLAFHPGDAHLFLELPAFPRRSQQPIYGLRRIGIAYERALHRPRFFVIACYGQIEISRIGIDDAAVIGGDDNGLRSAVNHRFDQRIATIGGRAHTQDSAGKGEQRKHANAGEDGEKSDGVLFGIAAAERHDRAECRNQRHRDQQHHDYAAAAFGAGGLAKRRADFSAARLP